MQALTDSVKDLTTIIAGIKQHFDIIDSKLLHVDNRLSMIENRVASLESLLRDELRELRYNLPQRRAD